MQYTTQPLSLVISSDKLSRIWSHQSTGRLQKITVLVKQPPVWSGAGWRSHFRQRHADALLLTAVLPARHWSRPSGLAEPAHLARDTPWCLLHLGRL